MLHIGVEPTGKQIYFSFNSTFNLIEIIPYGIRHFVKFKAQVEQLYKAFISRGSIRHQKLKKLTWNEVLLLAWQHVVCVSAAAWRDSWRESLSDRFRPSRLFL